MSVIAKIDCLKRLRSRGRRRCEKTCRRAAYSYEHRRQQRPRLLPQDRRQRVEQAARGRLILVLSRTDQSSQRGSRPGQVIAPLKRDRSGYRDDQRPARSNRTDHSTQGRIRRLLRSTALAVALGSFLPLPMPVTGIVFDPAAYADPYTGAIPEWIRSACCGPADVHRLAIGQVQEVDAQGHCARAQMPTRMQSGSGILITSSLDSRSRALTLRCVEPRDQYVWAFYRDGHLPRACVASSRASDRWVPVKRIILSPLSLAKLSRSGLSPYAPGFCASGDYLGEGDLDARGLTADADRARRMLDRKFAQTLQTTVFEKTGVPFRTEHVHRRPRVKKDRPATVRQITDVHTHARFQTKRQ